MNRKGIVLAGGTGTRLFPATTAISKQLLPIYDKPMIYYPICTLMQSGIRDILIISTPNDLPLFKRLLGDGKQWGLNFSYTIQSSPDGIAHAFILGKEFIDKDPVTLILGDNIFYGNGLTEMLQNANKKETGATVFGYYVKDPERYGVIEFDEHHNLNIVEKPENPKTNYAVTGLYYYDNTVIDIATDLKPSPRGELEITDLNREYIKLGKLQVGFFNRGIAWLDTGTHQSLLQASNFIETIEQRQGLKIGCPEEIAFRSGWITSDEVLKLGDKMKNNEYGMYLKNLVHGEFNVK